MRRPFIQTENLNTDQTVQIERAKLSKPDVSERSLSFYRSNPHASYEEIARAIGRSLGAVANYMKELKQQKRSQVTNDAVEVRVHCTTAHDLQGVRRSTEMRQGVNAFCTAPADK